MSHITTNKNNGISYSCSVAHGSKRSSAAMNFQQYLYTILQYAIYLPLSFKYAILFIS